MESNISSTADIIIINSTTVAPARRAEWLLILEYISAILMTCNTITLMLAMGAATHWREVWHHLRRPWGTLLGMLCQFAFLPGLGFGLCMAFKLPPYQAIGVLILTCSPSGAFSTFFAYWMEGDVALSILMTAVSSLLAFGMMPLNLWVYSHHLASYDIKMPYDNILISLAFATVPVIVGMVIRHFTRKWANYIAKICGLLGWIGAFACGILLILVYWDVILDTSVNLVITAALVPLISVIVAFLLSKMVCFKNSVSRTIAIETGCQNMVVATSVMLLSFKHPLIRGQMIIFPVLYGLCQLAEVAVMVGIFQLWSYCHRDNIVAEEVKSVIDDSVLTSVPVPAHRLSESRIVKMTGYAGTPDVCRLQKEKHQQQQEKENSTYFRYSESSSMRDNEEVPEEAAKFLRDNQPLVSDEVDHPNNRRQTEDELQGEHKKIRQTDPVESPYPFYSRPREPTLFSFPQNQDFNSPRTEDETHSDKDNDSIDHLYGYWKYGSNAPKSPTLSNKGVPNMFPVTEDDILPSRESSPIPYGSPLPPNKDRIHSPVWDSPSLPTSPTPFLPLSPSSSSSTFGFYHNDVRIGQADQFRTFTRSKK